MKITIGQNVYIAASLHLSKFRSVILDIKAVLSTVADEVVGFVQRLLGQKAGAVTALWHHQHIVLKHKHKRKRNLIIIVIFEHRINLSANDTHQPQCLPVWNTQGQDDLMVRHIQDNLVL